jgi:hypothetical protein
MEDTLLRKGYPPFLRGVENFSGRGGKFFGEGWKTFLSGVGKGI